MSVTNYIWDVENDSYLMETDENGETTVAYTNEPGLYGPLISHYRDTEVSTYHFDGRESVSDLTIESEIVKGRQWYAAFGKTVAHLGDFDTAFQFVGALGYYSSENTIGVYVRQRTYDEELGRWLSNDPAGFVDGVNRFSYATNAPTNVADPTGNSVHAECGVDEEAVEIPKNCCCRVVQANWAHMGVIDEPRVINKRFRCGNRHKITSSLSYPFEPGGDCTVEWWEHSTHQYTVAFGPTVLPLTWTEAFVGTDNNSTKPWRQRKKICGTMESVPINDEPSISKSGARRFRELFIVVRISGGCTNNPGVAMFSIRQQLYRNNQQCRNAYITHGIPKSLLPKPFPIIAPWFNALP